MTGDALKEIKKAEENGAQLIVNARIESQYRLEQTVKEIERSKAQAKLRFEEIFNNRINAANTQAEELRAARHEQAMREADALSAEARKNTDRAISIIIEEIKSLWQ